MKDTWLSQTFFSGPEVDHYTLTKLISSDQNESCCDSNRKKEHLQLLIHKEFSGFSLKTINLNEKEVTVVFDGAMYLIENRIIWNHLACIQHFPKSLLYLVSDPQTYVFVAWV